MFTRNPWKMDLPDLIHRQQCVGVEEGIVRDVVATQIKQPLKTKNVDIDLIYMPDPLEPRHTACVHDFHNVIVIGKTPANAEIRSH